MAGITYFSARQAFVNERQSAAQHQAFVNASFVQNASGQGTPPLAARSVDALSGSRSVLYRPTPAVVQHLLLRGPERLPSSHAPHGHLGDGGHEMFDLGGTPELVVGVPLTAVQASYFEVFSLDELARTLRVLALALGAAAW